MTDVLSGTLYGREGVERRTKLPGRAILTQVRFPCVVRDFSPRVNFSADSLTVFAQPPCVIACTNNCAHFIVDNFNPLTVIPLLGHSKIKPTVVGMGSAALAAAPYPGY